MMKVNSVAILIAPVLVGLLPLITPVYGDICLLTYQMADNDLEVDMRKDHTELIDSILVHDPTVTTWVYFDGGVNATEPLPFIYESDGVTLITEKFEGSRYMHFDHDFDHMVIAKTLPDEVNSDDPSVVYDFVKYAVSDCVQKGSNEFFMVLSSHGGGFDGFGGDDTTRQQTNLDLASALQRALSDVPGAPKVFDVLGFDACLMASIGALDEYRHVANYYLASEATEPGHGWAYDYLSDASSALALADEILSSFLEQSQNSTGYQETPKTLSLVDTAKFTIFLTAWDMLSEEFEYLLLNDVSFFADLHRSRQQAFAFDSVTDSLTTTSAVDIGTFLTTLERVCYPNENSNLSALLAQARASYDDMFISRGVGQGTSVEATGMHVYWPLKDIFLEDDLYEYVFEEPYATLSAPRYLEFLRAYYYSSTPDDDSDISVCNYGAFSDIPAQFEGQLLLNPTANVVNQSYVFVESELSLTTDYAFVAYGFDLTASLENRFRRHLQMGPSKSSFSNRQPGLHPNSDNRFEHYFESHLLSRRAQAFRKSGDEKDSEENYLFYYGGDMDGYYNGSHYTAGWDGYSLALTLDSENHELLFLKNTGNYSYESPVMYFPEGVDLSSVEFPLLSIQEGEQLGGMSGVLSFSEWVDAFDLYAHDDDGLVAISTEQGGTFVPIHLVQGYFDGYELEVLVGAADSPIYEWKTQRTFYLEALLPVEIFPESYGVSIVLNFFALNFDDVGLDGDDSKGVDYAIFFLDTDFTIMGPPIVPWKDYKSSTKQGGENNEVEVGEKFDGGWSDFMDRESNADGDSVKKNDISWKNFKEGQESVEEDYEDAKDAIQAPNDDLMKTDGKQVELDLVKVGGVRYNAAPSDGQKGSEKNIREKGDGGWGHN